MPEQFKIEPELIEKLLKIYNYFDGRRNKMEKLFEECGEYRDRYLLNDKSSILEPRIVVEICDNISVNLQLLFTEPILQEGLIKVVDKACEKIDSGYYK